VNAISSEMLNSGYYSDGVLGPIGTPLLLWIAFQLPFQQQRLQVLEFGSYLALLCPLAV
jgi:hypothetical protein